MAEMSDTGIVSPMWKILIPAKEKSAEI